MWKREFSWISQNIWLATFGWIEANAFKMGKKKMSKEERKKYEAEKAEALRVEMEKERYLANIQMIERNRFPWRNVA